MSFWWLFSGFKAQPPLNCGIPCPSVKEPQPTSGRPTSAKTGWAGSSGLDQTLCELSKVLYAAGLKCAITKISSSASIKQSWETSDQEHHNFLWKYVRRCYPQCWAKKQLQPWFSLCGCCLCVRCGRSACWGNFHHYKCVTHRQPQVSDQACSSLWSM